MSKESTKNYTEQDVQKMTQIHEAALAEHPDLPAYEAQLLAINEIQKVTGRSVPSIRSKLGNLGIYIKKPDTPKKEKRTTKANLVGVLAKNEPKKPTGFFDSIESARADVIQYVIKLQEVLQDNKRVLDLPEVKKVLQAHIDDLHAKANVAGK